MWPPSRVWKGRTPWNASLQLRWEILSSRNGTYIHLTLSCWRASVSSQWLRDGWQSCMQERCFMYFMFVPLKPPILSCAFSSAFSNRLQRNPPTYIVRFVCISSLSSVIVLQSFFFYLFCFNSNLIFVVFWNESVAADDTHQAHLELTRWQWVS